tara:strand:- start:190 stop:1029 length:840 start_codon:yes stop_codon:yes gene_type:complete
MKKLKHSKYKNTGLVFEILTRNIVKEVLNEKNSISLNIIKKYFTEGSEIYKELKYYQTLQEINPNIQKTDKLVDLIIDTYNSRIDQHKLNNEKYRLIGEIKNKLNFDIFFESRISNYKLLASIYKIFEHAASDNPSEHISCRELIVDHIAGKDQHEKVLTDVQTVWKNEDPDIQKLAFKIIVEKFNTKYKYLGERQKTLLNKFVNEDTNTVEFRDYVYNEVGGIKKKLNRIMHGVDDDVMVIKLREAIKLVDNIIMSPEVQSEHLSAMLKYYELIEELS